MRLGRHRGISLAVLLLGAGSGCALVLGFDETTLRSGDVEGGIEGGSDEGGNLPPDAGPSRLTTKPAAPVLRRGSKTDVTVEIARGADVTGIVTARLSDLPVGVSATTAVLAAGVATGTLQLTAMANATLGPKTITLTAEGTALPPADILLLVADPAGAPDITFDADGFVVDSSRGPASTFFSAAVQTDQKIIAGGAAGLAAGQPLSGWLVRRYAPDGVPDAAFTTQLGAALPADGELRALTLDAMGNVVCAGFSLPGLQQALTVLRIKPTGELDKTFGAPTGIVRLPLEAPGPSFGFGVTVQADGKVVVVGSRRALNGANEGGIIVRFDASGARDATFNGGATVVVPGTRFVGVAADAMGIVAGGSAVVGAPSYVLTRRTAQGANDPTFGMGGTAAFGNTFRANGFARLADGSIALVGDVQQGAAGYTAGVAGLKGTAVFARRYGEPPGASFFGVAVQTDNRIIAAGHTPFGNGEARVARLLADGNPDTSFGDGGTSFVESLGAPNQVEVALYGAAVQADGRILAAGARTSPTSSGAVVFRLWP